MRRGSAAGKFVGIVQVSVASLTNIISAHILGSYSDETHVVIKAHSYFKKLPLHSGSRFADLMDLKLMGITTSSQYAPVDTDPYKGYDDQGNAVGVDFYKSFNPPATVIRHRINNSQSGDKEVYLFVPRDYAAPLAFGSTNNDAVRFYIAADFADGSSVPVYMEVKRMPAVRVDFSDISKLQIGSPEGGNTDHMTVGVSTDPDAGFGTGVAIRSLYSFGKWTNNNYDQNADLQYIYGTGNYFQPWALPVFRVATNAASTAALTGTQLFRRQSDGKNTCALRWVTGKTKAYSGYNVPGGLQGDTATTAPDTGKINLGQFFQMDRIDTSEPNASGGLQSSTLNTGTGSRLSDGTYISYGRRYGSINYFAKNHTKEHDPSFYDTYPTSANGQADTSYGNNGNRLGLGPTLGCTYAGRQENISNITPGTDLTSNATNGASLLYSPSLATDILYTHLQYNLFEAPENMGSVFHPAGKRCVASYLGHNAHGGSVLSDYITVVKDIKSNFFDQGQDYKAGPPMVVTARQLVLGEGYIRKDIDTCAYSMLAGPTTAGNSTIDQFYIPAGTDTFFTRANAYSDDHRGAYSITWNNAESLTGSSSKPFNTGSGAFPLAEASEKFKGVPMDGLELIANWLMGGTGSVGIPGITPDKTKYYEGQPTKLYPVGIADALNNLAIHTATTATDPDVTNADHSGKCMISTDINGSPFNIQIGQGDYTEGTFGSFTTPRKQIQIAGYQDVIFIVGMGTTTKNVGTPVTTGAVTDWTLNLPWFGADAFMASIPGHPYSNDPVSSSGNYTTQGGPSGTYYRAEDNQPGANSGPSVARLISYRNQSGDYLFGSVTAVYSPIQAFASSNTTVCTDPVVPIGRSNFDAGEISTGLNFTTGGLGYATADLQYLNNGHASQFRFTGIPGPAGASQQNCSELIGSLVAPTEFQVEITDDAGGFGYNTTQEEFGFQGLRVKGSFIYLNANTTGGASSLITSTGQKATTDTTEILNLWNIKLTPGNASDSDSLFSFAQSVSPNDDPSDIEYLEIKSLGNNYYDLRFTFRNTENVLQATEIPQVFPDLPFKRAVPLKNANGMLHTWANTTSNGTSNTIGNILYDSYKSGFFNNHYGVVGSQSSHSGRVLTYYEADGGEAYDANIYSPRRSTKLSVRPVSYANKEFISNFVTYGDFSEQAGCTDPTAPNYNPLAIVDDGTCIETITGCTDPAADNYNPSANTDDGSCTYCDNYFSNFTRQISPFNDFNDTAISGAVNGSGVNTPLTSCMGMKFGNWIGGADGTTGNDLGISNENLASNLLPTTFDNVFQGSPSAADAPWIYSLQNVGVFIPENNIPFAAVTEDIGLSMVLGNTFISGLGDNALEAVETVGNHELRIYPATESIISYIMDNNNNTGQGADAIAAQANPFISTTETGVVGMTYIGGVSVSALQAAGNTASIVLNSAESVLTTSANSDTRIARFKFTGDGAQTATSLSNSTLYVAEYAFIDKSCTDVNFYTSFYGFFMVGTCGCTVFGNQNAPSLYPWQTAGISTLPVAYNLMPNCVNKYVEIAPSGEGDQGTSLCFTPDAELSSCDSLYQQCILNPTTICIEDGITDLEDPSVIFNNGVYYYSQETTVTVRIDGIWNPTTNQYQINNYLNYVIIPVLDGVEVPELSQDTADGVEAVLDNTVIGLTHDFTFGNVSSYSFIIVYTNPTGGIYSDIVGLGPNCQIQLPPIDVVNDCIISTGCTDPDAINTDPNATFDDGSCQYADCEQIFLETVGGFTGTNITATNTSSECTTIETTVLGQTVTTPYTQVNSTGTITVNVIVDHAIEEFPASECYIVLTPASTTGIVGVGSTSELLQLVIQNWATTTTEGGSIDLGSGATATISPLQQLDVLYTATGSTTDYTNGANGSGYTFENLPQGLYFIFVIPPPDLLNGLTEYYVSSCSSQTIFYLDEFTTASVGVDDPTNGPCQEGCANPLGCDDEVFGCTDPDNELYDPTATVDDGSCAAAPECPPGSTDPACIDCTTEFAIRLIGGDIKRRIDDGAQDPCDPTQEGEGCTDPNACNYDPFIDTSNSNNQLCDYCSCQPDSIDCCQGEDCGCDPEVDENCAPPPPPPCPDPTNPDCNPQPPQPCYIQEECPPPPPPCVVLGNCPPPPPPPPPVKDPVIEVVVPTSVTCEPDFINQDLWSEVQNAAMLCASNEGTKMVIKLKHGIEFDEEDLIKLDLITYLFNGGADGQELPCLFNCSYETKTRFDKYTAKEKWANGGFKKWASTDTYKKGTIVAYFYNMRGRTHISYFSAMRDIAPKEIHPKYKSSGWKQIVDIQPKTVDPLKISNGTEPYLEDLYNYFVRFCQSCSVQAAPEPKDHSRVTDDRRNAVGISKPGASQTSQTGIIGPDGEEIIF